MSQVLTDDPDRSILQVRNLKMVFKKHHGTIFRKQSLVRAVNDVSFDVRKGEILSIVGESGSGKTTVARCILKLQIPTAGSISYDGAEVTRLKGHKLRDYRRDVQIIYQDPYESLSPRMDIYSQIALPLHYLLGEKDTPHTEEMVYRLLEEVQLDPERVATKYPHQLSGGERQRVNIARALASDPKLLIADEPITMLDAALRMSVIRLLFKLKAKRNLTILLITHDMVSAKILSTRTIVMYFGKIFEIGDSRDVFLAPQHPYVELLREATPKLHSASGLMDDQFASSIEASERVSAGCIFRPRCKFATEVCAEVEPPLTEKSSSHFSACHNPLSLRPDRSKLESSSMKA
jgi:peptide/nickel transport system ATP-binding protein